MAFKQKKWIDIPDPNNLPDVPEGQDSLAILDANNMNRIEDGIVESMIENNVKNLVFEKITSSCSWVAPKAYKQNFKIFCVGGGGGGETGRNNNTSSTQKAGGGGGGYVEIAEITIPENTEIDIVCGAGGKSSNKYATATATDGGTTSFGDFLVAEGGKAGSNGTGGNGGAGGGGASGKNGGNGSKYGGGGGGIIGGTGGEYSGNGGSNGVEGVEGRTFDDPIINVLFMIDKIPYKTPVSSYGSGYGFGGFGGCGGSSSEGGYGGGGGYCGHGGNGMKGGGGGGGYCGNGGYGDYGPYNTAGGGGGGFFCDGCSAYKFSGDTYTNGGSGGGFFSSGDTYVGGTGGVLIMYIKED